MQALGYDNRMVAFDAEGLKAVSIASTKVLHLPGVTADPKNVTLNIFLIYIHIPYYTTVVSIFFSVIPILPGSLPLPWQILSGLISGW